MREFYFVKNNSHKKHIAKCNEALKKTIRASTFVLSNLLQE